MKLVAAIFLLMLLVGCASHPPAEDWTPKGPTLHDLTAKLPSYLEQALVIGMDKEEVRTSLGWGEPVRTITLRGGISTYQEWQYHSASFFFRDDKLTAWTVHE